MCEAVIEGLKAEGREGGRRGCSMFVCGRPAAMSARADASESGEGSASISASLVVKWYGGLGGLLHGRWSCELCIKAMLWLILGYV